VNLRHAESGFSIVPQVFVASELDGIMRELDTHSVQRSRAGARHLLSVPAIAAVARDARLINLATEALGRAPAPFGATLFDKSPEANWLVTWHQDRSLPLLERREAPGWGPWSGKGGVIYAHAPADVLASVVAIRLHLDDSTEDNGPLRVLPGTHRSGVLSDAQIHDAAQRIEPVVCTVDRGGVVIMRPLLVHASSKVTAPAPRRVLHFEYAASPVFEHGLRLRAE
jgi:ectoine hydroxylase-related dioxygenase (phytanoyl-CoA dioxygenase family)